MAGDIFAAVIQGHGEKIARAWIRAVELSYRDHPMRHKTAAETKRRAEICEKWTRRLVSDWKWELDRALSHVREALDAELSGREYSPLQSRTMWSPDAEVLGGT